MKILVYIVSLFYRWYNNQKSSKEIAYESAIMALLLFLWMNLLTISKLFGINIISFNFDELSKIEQWSKVLYYGIPSYILFTILIPKKKILSLDIEKRNQDIDYFILISYCVVSVALLVIVAIKYGVVA